MYLKFSNFKFDGKTINNLVEITNIIKRSFYKNGIDISITYIINENSVIIKSNGDKLFMSNVINYIKLSTNDKRIDKLGRNYLESNRLTEKQFDSVNGILKNVLLNIHITCDITLHEFDDDPISFIMLRSERGEFNSLPKPRSFTLEAL